MLLPASPPATPRGTREIAARQSTAVVLGSAPRLEKVFWEIEEMAFGRVMNRQILILHAIEFRTDELLNFA